MKVLCEISVRHVHLSQKDLELLFGKNAKLEPVRPLSQPGQYLAAQKIDIVGPKRTMESVAILGPVRAETQVEIARTDCYTLGVKNVPVRLSSDLAGTPGITLKNGDKTVQLEKGLIVMQRHVHMHTSTAEKHGFKDKQLVDLVFAGPRGGVLSNAIVRVDKNAADAVHLDSDEGNALESGAEVVIKK